MPINVEYGPISTALGLAQKAGAGVRFRQQQQTDQAFINQVQQRQAQEDAAYANTIHNATVGDMNQASLQARVSDQNNDYALGQQKIASIAANDAAQRQISQQNANTAFANSQVNQQRATDTALHNTTVDDIAQQRVDKPTGGADHEYRLMSEEARRLMVLQQQAQKAMDAASYDENDLKKIGTRQSVKTPGAIEGHEQQFVSASQQLKDLSARLQQANDYLSQHAQSVIAPNAAPVNRQVLANYASQSAPAQQPRILAKERNPQDGKMWGYDANQGRWVPLE